MERKYLLAIVLAITVAANAFVVLQQKPRHISSKPQTYTQPQQPHPQIPKPEVKPNDVLSLIKAKDMQRCVEYLASPELEGRMSGSPGCDKARTYIVGEYEKLGIPTKVQPFQVQTGTTNNVCAWIEGVDPSLKDQVIVVGAHYDHIGMGNGLARDRKQAVHPGADDNASGTSAVLELAKAFVQLKSLNRRTVVFQNYSGEELGLKGSEYYCKNPLFPVGRPAIKSHVFMCNFDMIGYLARQTSLRQSEGESPMINDIVTKLNSKYVFASKVTNRGGGGSDQASFNKYGVPIVFIHTGLHDAYHTVNDTADKLNYEGMEQIAKYGFELVWAVTQSDDVPRIQWSVGQKSMPTHDHDVVPFPE